MTLDPQVFQILVSFCNTTPGAPAMALIDADTRAVRVLRVPPELAIGRASGLAISDRYLFVVTTRTIGAARPSLDPPNPSNLFVFDRRDLSLLTAYRCSSVIDGHSLRVVGDGLDDGAHCLDVVSTGTDEVIRLTLKGSDVVSERVLWRPDPEGPRADVHHLNALGLWRGKPLVSAFGKKSGVTWSTAHDGFIASIETGERLAAGISHPHTLLDLEGDLVYCESATGTVRVFRSDAVQRVPGYARGIARVGERLFVGTSRARQVSKSTGLLTNRSDPGAAAGQCSVVCLSARTLAIEYGINLDHMALEIYDVLAVSGTEGWPVVTETDWRDSLIVGLVAAFEERDATIAWLHTEVSKRDATVAWLHKEVAERDQVVAWLHQEVARRDALIEAQHTPDGRAPEDTARPDR